MTEALIGVVIPAYNYARTLGRAVESVLAQLDEADAQLLVIDDGSTDETPQVLEALLAKHRDVSGPCASPMAAWPRCAIAGLKSLLAST